MKYLIELLFKNFSAVWFLILENHILPSFFDIREPYIVSSPLCKGGGGDRIQTKHVSGQIFGDNLVERTRRENSMFFSVGETC